MTSDDRKWIEGKFDSLTREVVLLRVGVAKLSVKCGVWGLVGGSIPVLIMLAIIVIRGN